MILIGLGRYSQYRYRHQPIRIDTAIMLYRYRWWWQLQKKTTTIPDPKLFVSHLIFIQLTKDLSILSLIRIMLNLYLWKTPYHYVLELACVGFTAKINPKHSLCCWNTKLLIFKSQVMYMCIVSNTYRIGKVRIEYISIRLMTVSSQP